MNPLHYLADKIASGCSQLSFLFLKQIEDLLFSEGPEETQRGKQKQNLSFYTNVELFSQVGS